MNQVSVADASDAGPLTGGGRYGSGVAGHATASGNVSALIAETSAIWYADQALK